jgi:haloacid dehalogenase-like hydrolase
MTTIHHIHRRAVLAGLLTSVAGGVALSSNLALAQNDPLPSWNDGKAKQSIVDFVNVVTREGSPGFVPVPQRVATFDNDGTLWCEQPMYVQLAFALDQVKALAPQHPEWKKKQPFKAVLDGDMKALAEAGQRGLVELVMATHANMSTEDFERVIRDWLSTARHPRFKQPYTDVVYQPMIELLAYLRANGFKTYIVSGGGIEFMRPWTDRVYSVPPAQVVGSSIKTRFMLRSDTPILLRLPQINFVDDGPGKPVGIKFHHTDGEREYAYDRKSHFGKLDKALDAAALNDWTVVSMKNDWKRIFKFA